MKRFLDDFTRNAIYVGALIVFASLPVYAGSVYGFLAGVAMVPVFLMRIRLEEDLLGDHFGEEYEAYQRRTKRLIPLLY